MDIDENETRKKCRYKNSSHYTKTRLILFAVDRWASRISRSLYFLCVSMFIMRSLKTTFFLVLINRSRYKAEEKKMKEQKMGMWHSTLCVWGIIFVT